MKFNLFNTVNNEEGAGVVSSQCFGSSAVSLACITSMCWYSIFLVAIYPHPSPLYFSTNKSV